jgi:hypothetical protein
VEEAVGGADCPASTEGDGGGGAATAWAIAADESAHPAVSAVAPKIFKFTENSPTRLHHRSSKFRKEKTRAGG